MRADARTPRPSRVLGAVAALVLAATVLTGCGGDDPSAAGEVPAVTSAGDAPIALLTRKQARAALLTGQNLGGGFRVSDSDDGEDDDRSMGCLDALDAGEDRASITAERTFDAVGELGVPTLTTGVYSYDDVALASDPFQAVVTALDGCTRVDETNATGTRVRLDVVVDTTTVSPDADEQVNLTATGSVVVRGRKVPFGIWTSALRVGNHVVSVSYSGLDLAVGPTAVAALTRAAVDRLVAVVAGEEPSQTLVGTGAQIAA